MVKTKAKTSIKQDEGQFSIIRVLNVALKAKNMNRVALIL